MEMYLFNFYEISYFEYIHWCVTPNTITDVASNCTFQFSVEDEHTCFEQIKSSKWPPFKPEVNNNY